MNTFLVILAAAVLVKNGMKPNTYYVFMIVRHHIIHFILNLTAQIFLVALRANILTVTSLTELFRDTHANKNCARVSRIVFKSTSGSSEVCRHTSNIQTPALTEVP